MKLIMENWKKFLNEDKVSDKIGILKDEGYPEDQAVAIAHSMKRQNKLEEYTADEVRAIMSAGERAKAEPPAPPQVPACDPESEEINIEILNAAIEALEGSDMADQLECFRSQLRRAFADDGEDASPRPDFGAPLEPGVVGFEEE